MAWERLLPGAAALLLIVGAATVMVGDRPEDSTSASAARSHPFLVGRVPAGFQLVTAGRGTETQRWGDDDGGTEEPFTVLEGDGGSVMVVSVTGFEGYQGLLDQASPGGSDGRGQHFELDNREAIFSPATEKQWADLVAIRGDDLAVRVTSRKGTRDELVEMIRRTQPAADHATAPSVDAPESWSSVGSVHADTLLALSPSVRPLTNDRPGPKSAHGAFWKSDDHHLAVMTLPGAAADLDALLHKRHSPHEDATSQSLKVEGRAAVALDSCYCEPGSDATYRTRAVVTTDEAGAVVVVVARGEERPGGQRVPAIGELVGVVESVEPADGRQWDEFLIEATGGPGLNPDAGEVEIVRGERAGLEWLLQTVHPGGDGVLFEQQGFLEGDYCLKLSNRKRACASGGGPVGSAVFMTRGGVRAPADPEFPPFVIVITEVAGAKIRVQTSTDSATGELYPLPESKGWIGVVFIDGAVNENCHSGTPPLPGNTRIEVLDANDDVLTCIDDNAEIPAPPPGG